MLDLTSQEHKEDILKQEAQKLHFLVLTTNPKPLPWKSSFSGVGWKTSLTYNSLVTGQKNVPSPQVTINHQNKYRSERHHPAPGCKISLGVLFKTVLLNLVFITYHFWSKLDHLGPRSWGWCSFASVLCYLSQQLPVPIYFIKQDPQQRSYSEEEKKKKNKTKKKIPSRYNIWLHCSWMQSPTSPFCHEVPKNNSSLKKSSYFYTVTRNTGLLLIIPSFLGMSICAQHNWLWHQWNHNTSSITGNWVSLVSPCEQFWENDSQKKAHFTVIFGVCVKKVPVWSRNRSYTDHDWKPNLLVTRIRNVPSKQDQQADS